MTTPLTILPTVLPIISSYGKYSSKNYGMNTIRLDFTNLTLYYSYRTLVAFSIPSGTFVRKNSWKSTTGKHLNWVNEITGGNKKDRLTSEEFEKAYQKHVVEKHSIK